MRIRLPMAAILPALILIGCGGGFFENEDTGLVRITARAYAYMAAGPSAGEGLGANSGFVVGDSTVLVIDTRYTPELASELLEAIRTVTDLPVSWVVNTHYHPDHVWGNSVFREEGALILSTRSTREEIEEYTPVYLQYYKEQKPESYAQLVNVRMALPDSLIEERVEIDLGGVTVAVEKAGPAHTAGDLVVYVPSERTLFAGGIASNGYHANMGDQGADYGIWTRTLERLSSGGVKHVVPGQGKVGGGGILSTQKRYIEEVVESGKESIRKGKTLSEAIESIAISGTEGFLQENMLPFNLQAVYKRYTLEMVKPDFTLDLPDDFSVSEGGGDSTNGRILWVQQTDTCYSEFEVEWKRTNIREVIIQDVHESVARHLQVHPDHEMTVEGSKRVEILGGEEPAAFGRWGYKRNDISMGMGVWLWTMVVSDGKLYSIKMSVNAGPDREMEKTCMGSLESIASTFRRNTG